MAEVAWQTAGCHTALWRLDHRLFCSHLGRRRWILKLAPNDQRSWTSAALRPSNHAEVSEFAVGHWVSVLVGGPSDGCGRGRKGLASLPMLQAAGPQFGTELQQNTMLLFQLRWDQLVDWLEIGKLIYSFIWSKFRVLGLGPGPALHQNCSGHKNDLFNFQVTGW
eukprot:1145791-Pelagomonas_calceolata.AAC.1